MNKKLNEASIESVLTAVRAYAALAGHYDSVYDLELQISQAWNHATRGEFTYEDHSVILGSQREAADVSRWGAWIAQGLFQTRACSVGNHLFQVKNSAESEARYTSSILGQLRQVGLKTRNIPWPAVIKLAHSVSRILPKKKIDGLLIRPGMNEIVVLKCVQIQRAKGNEPASLFNPKPAFSISDTVYSSDVLTLIVAEMMVRLAINSPSIDVRCVLMAVDPMHGNREFYAYDTTGTYAQQIKGSRFSVSNFKLIASSASMISRGEDVEGLANPPRLVVREPLMRLPVDRATRCMMLLDVMWHHQCNATGLRATKLSELSDEVERRFLIDYSSDHRRHDMEDCLVRESFVERPKYESNRYALTPAGVFQAIVGRRMLQTIDRPRSDVDAEEFVLAPIRRQARLWARYSRGEQVVE